MYAYLYLSEILIGVLSAQHNETGQSVANTCLPHRVNEISFDYSTIILGVMNDAFKNDVSCRTGIGLNDL
jgi:hypothetical protein